MPRFTVRIFSLGEPTGLYDLERKLTWSYKDRIVTDDHCPLDYIFRTLESYGLTEYDYYDYPAGATILYAPDPAENFETGETILYHASLEFKSEADRVRVCNAYQEYLDR